MKNISTNLQVNVGWQFIILLKINLLLMSLSVFNSAAIAQIFDPEILEEDCPVVSGAFFIRTYLVYVQTANDQWANALGSAELERRSRKTMEILNTVFNAHQVYFVASPPPGQDGNCYSIYTGTGYPDYSGGLTIQILSDGFAAKGVGQAGGGTLPAKYLYIGGSEDGIPASNLPVLIHEVGHCLGLAHTFRQISQGCDEISEDCEGNILPPAQQNPNYYCGCCGDYVCDTEYNDIETDSDVLVIDESCCCSTAPITGISPAIFKNFMSWSNPSRCRDRFTEGQIQRMRCYLYRASESVLEEILIAPETITGSVTWNTSQTKSTITEVLQGATLTVNAPVDMSPGSYIIVRRGGTLIVNSTITAACGGMWGGIIVEGNGNLPQKNQNGQYAAEQGRVVISASGIVEHAVSGIRAHGMIEDDADFGGGIAEVSGRIRNCINGVRFGRYRDGNKPNVSFFSGAFFTLDDNYRGPGTAKPVLMYLGEINRLSLAGTWFYDLRTQACTGRESRADGLVADDAAFRIHSCLFRNLDHGILASPLLAGGYGSYEVKNSFFFNCYTEIQSALPDPFIIQNNLFQVGRPPSCSLGQAAEPIRGIHLYGYELPQGIDISENNFEAEVNDPAETLAGTDCFGAGNMENFIRKNDYENLDYGNRAAGNNGGDTGLRYECNDNINNFEADFYVAPGGSVRAIQGNKDEDLGITTAAGNKFISSTYSWLNEGGQTITYYYNATDPEQDPNQSVFEGIDALPATQPNTSCATSGGCPPPCDPEVLNNHKSNFFAEKSDWLAKKALYPTLSGEAAQALAREIAAHRSVMDIEGGIVIRNYALDTTGANVDSVLVWTEHLHTYEADLRLARHYFFTNDLAGYGQWVVNIPVRHELSSTQSAELADFSEMLAAVRPSLETDVSLYKLSTAVLDNLEHWASDCNEAGFVAKEILRRNGREITSECEGESFYRNKPDNQKISAAVKVRLYPNPTGSHVHLEIQEQALPLNVEIISLDGRVIFQKTLAASGQIDVSNLSAGIYLCRFSARSDLLLHNKLIISH